GEATIRALYPAARNPFAFPELLTQEGLEPWTVTEAWLMADERAEHAVDITDTFDAKLAALRAHTSQTAHLGDSLENRLREWGTRNAEKAGMGPGRLAETFRVVATG
ncbi:MAG: PIG-L family deacetylase, partial [Actinomycetota bacterium]|nr:PIG-L family deacetylase [Actinomycetota bacterium]